MAAKCIAILDIGSNSVRLVVYEGPMRAPAVLFNEKVMAGLGRGLEAGGRLPPDGVELAVGAIARFALLIRAMGVVKLRAVATAAVRDSIDGPDLIARIKAETGISVEIIDGETEARGSALGVIAGIPEADGIVGDLGGGSVELIRVSGGEAHERVSLPLGALRLDAMRRSSPRALTARIKQMLDSIDWIEAGQGKPFYAVGGSWRGLAHLHMHLTDWPLPVIHHYVMPPDAPQRLMRTLSHISIKTLKRVPSISAARAPQLPGAAMLLKELVQHLGSNAIISSAYGLREGLLYGALGPAARAADPLLEAARSQAQRAARLGIATEMLLGDALLSFTDTLFSDDSASERRLRHAACLLADVAWRAHPDMRAEHGLDIALHGNWVGITASERAVLAATLFVLNGGRHPDPGTAVLARLAPPAALARAQLWGLALRLGQRLAGGAPGILAGARLERKAGLLILHLARAMAPLYGDAPARRHRLLADALGVEAELQLAAD
jgi:exopolyphosphatase/guanosine-5'-triphosphate,3'-diphosphate pyrophosphatase